MKYGLFVLAFAMIVSGCSSTQQAGTVDESEAAAPEFTINYPNEAEDALGNDINQDSLEFIESLNQ